MEGSRRVMDSPKFTDRHELRLIPKDEPSPQVLREIIDCIRAAIQQQPKPKLLPKKIPKPEEHVEHQKAIARAFVKIEQIASNVSDEAEQLKTRIAESGSNANDVEAEQAIRDLVSAVMFVIHLMGRVDAEPINL